ncbi:hypothetical protein [Streptomyces sp. NPDC052114]|uniref:hypothetical protein n=1 Tax=unclassified Streptomyces TaxID=2593676 RepID=UPI0034422EA2
MTVLETSDDTRTAQTDVAAVPTTETVGAETPADDRPRRPLIRRSVRDVFLGVAVWLLLFRWLVHGEERTPVSSLGLVAGLVTVTVWVTGAALLRGKEDRAARWIAGESAALAVSAVAWACAVRPASTSLVDLPTPAASGLLLAAAAGLGLWARYAERRSR